MDKTLQIRVAGFGGQGVMLFGQLLSYVATDKQLNTVWYPSYGPETRGGTANCSVVISEKTINSPVFKNATHLVAFNGPSLDKFAASIEDDGFIIYNSSIVDGSLLSKVTHRKIGVPINEIANQLGNPKVINMVLLGAYLSLSKLFSVEDVMQALTKLWGESKAHLLEINRSALQRGVDYIETHGVQL